MTETTLCKETIKFLIESLKEDPEYTEHPYSEYDRGRKSGIGYVIWKLTQQHHHHSNGKRGTLEKLVQGHPQSPYDAL